MNTKKDKQTPCVLKVEQALAARDDFTLLSTLVEMTKLTANQVGASLHHLKKYQVIDCMESDGRLWWYPTPGQDLRVRHLEERAPEEKPRAPRVRRSREFTFEQGRTSSVSGRPLPDVPGLLGSSGDD